MLANRERRTGVDEYLVSLWDPTSFEAEQYRQQHRALGESLAASDATKRLKAGAGSKRPIATSVIMGNPARGLYEMNLPGDAG